MYKVVFYQDKNGQSEVNSYIQELKNNVNKDSKIKLGKIMAYLKMLESSGLALGKPYIKHIKGEIWELRPIKDRILFAYLEKDKFIILTYFIKKTQKTPKREIERAKRYLQEYQNRRNLYG